MRQNPDFKNQISADDRKRGGARESTKDSGVLIVNVAARQTAAENVSFICHASCCRFYAEFSTSNFFCVWVSFSSAEGSEAAWHYEHERQSLAHLPSQCQAVQ